MALIHRRDDGVDLSGIAHVADHADRLVLGGDCVGGDPDGCALHDEPLHHAEPEPVRAAGDQRARRRIVPLRVIAPWFRNAARVRGRRFDPGANESLVRVGTPRQTGDAAFSQ